MRYEKAVAPQIDTMVDLKAQYEEMKQRFEECRNENIGLKKMNNL